MPRKTTSRMTKSSLQDLEKRARKAFIELNTISAQLKEWGGAAEKISHWDDDIDKAVDKVEDVMYSMRLVLKGGTHEPLDDYNYSFMSLSRMVEGGVRIKD